MKGKVGQTSNNNLKRKGGSSQRQMKYKKKKEKIWPSPGSNRGSFLRTEPLMPPGVSLVLPGVSLVPLGTLLPLSHWAIVEIFCKDLRIISLLAIGNA